MFQITFLILVAACIVWQLCSMLQGWENSRFARSQLTDHRTVRAEEQRTTLYLPCKDDDGDLAENLQGFFQQQHPNYQLVFIVESTGDPAYEVIREIRQRYPHVDCKVVIAGIAREHGQKVHNLLVATAEIDPQTQALAFADADIRPDPDWLHTISTSLYSNRNPDAVTGYRWLVPERNSLSNLILYSINSITSGFLGRVSSHHLIWGGSWSIRRENFDRFQVRDAWRGTLSDDLVATNSVRQQGGKIDYDPRCLSVSRFDMNWSRMFEFLRRQYLIGRKYTPQFLWPGYVMLLVCVSAWWALVAAAITNAGSQTGWLCLAGAVTVYLANVVKGTLRQSVFRVRDTRVFQRNLAAAAFDVLAWPIVSSVMLLVLTISLPGSRIWWRGNHYLIKRGGQIQLLNPGPDAIAETPPQRKAA